MYKVAGSTPPSEACQHVALGFARRLISISARPWRKSPEALDHLLPETVLLIIAAYPRPGDSRTAESLKARPSKAEAC
jgi:hypothetical protein